MKPRMIGTINGYILSAAKFGRKRFNFDGTIKGLTVSALKAGAAGKIVAADFGGGFSNYLIEAAPHDDRAGGYWAVEA